MNYSTVSFIVKERGLNQRKPLEIKLRRVASYKLINFSLHASPPRKDSNGKIMNIIKVK
jgi:hypothetical protein